MNLPPDAPATTSRDPSAGLTQTPNRIVIILGRESAFDPGPLITTAWRRRLKLVVFVLGLPLTTTQEHVCEAALEVAGRQLIELEQRVIFDPRRIAACIEASDRVVLAVSPAEQDQLGWE